MTAKFLKVKQMALSLRNETVIKITQFPVLICSIQQWRQENYDEMKLKSPTAKLAKGLKPKTILISFSAC